MARRNRKVEREEMDVRRVLLLEEKKELKDFW